MRFRTRHTPVAAARPSHITEAPTYRRTRPGSVVSKMLAAVLVAAQDIYRERPN